MKRGFTLIELLVVVSIVSLLSSIMYSNLAQAREKARDNARIQQVHQIDNAVSLYTNAKGHAPDFGGRCGAGDPHPDITVCAARSTAAPNSAQALAWSDFLTDIQPFMSTVQIQSDPCGFSGCASGTGNSGEVTGYVYVAPEGMEALCGSGCPSGNSIADSYQLYAVVETSPTPQGQSSFGVFYNTQSPANSPVIDYLLPNNIEYGLGSTVNVMGKHFTPSGNTLIWTPVTTVTSVKTIPGLTGIIGVVAPPNGTIQDVVQYTIPGIGFYATTYQLQVSNTNGVSNPIPINVVH